MNAWCNLVDLLQVSSVQFMCREQALMVGVKVRSRFGSFREGQVCGADERRGAPVLQSSGRQRRRALTSAGCSVEGPRDAGDVKLNGDDGDTS